MLFSVSIVYVVIAVPFAAGLAGHGHRSLRCLEQASQFCGLGLAAWVGRTRITIVGPAALALPI
jgi:hypothetical protein